MVDVSKLHAALLARCTDWAEYLPDGAYATAVRAIVNRHAPVRAAMPGAVTGWLVCNGCGKAWPDECADTLLVAEAMGVGG